MNSKMYKKIVISIFIIAGILRIIYAIKMPEYKNQYDWVNNLDGHRDYIYGLYKYNKLPESNSYQFYHPPFYHFTCALWMKVLGIFTSNLSVLFESLQILVSIYSLATMWIVLKITDELKIKEKYKIIILFIMAFYPRFIILSGSLNNDTLSIMLMIWAILRLIKWYKKDDIKNTVFLAILTGLAVMTKTIAGIISIPILYVFLLKLYRVIRKKQYKKIKKYIILYFIFGIIALPIGLWYHVRNYILFNQPILYVLDPAVERLYVGYYSWFERLFSFGYELFEKYCNSNTNNNMLIFVFKSSLFGEFSWNKNFSLMYALTIIYNFIFWICMIISTTMQIIQKSKRNIVEKIIFISLIAINIISFIISNTRLEYTCTADFRFLIICFISALILMGMELSKKDIQTFDNIICIAIFFICVFGDVLILI